MVEGQTKRESISKYLFHQIFNLKIVLNLYIDYFCFNDQWEYLSFSLYDYPEFKKKLECLIENDPLIVECKVG